MFSSEVVGIGDEKMAGLKIDPSVKIFLNSVGDYFFYGCDCAGEGVVLFERLLVVDLFAHLYCLDGLGGVGVYLRLRVP